jgi:RNA polymerase sigma-70 factor (ECF subfamily)
VTDWTDNEWLAARFEQQRGRLTAVAYRMLGSEAEADDAVQETWLRLSRSDADEIENLGAWLTTVVSRVCLNLLQARRAHPELSLEEGEAGAPLAEPAAGPDPEDEALLAESVGLALLVVLDALSPPERVAFVLHDMFGVSFEEIGPVLGRSNAATRQLASRARRRVRFQDDTGEADRVRQAKVVDAFLAAAREGDFERLLALLDPEVVLTADPTAVELGTSGEIHGAEAVARFSRLARGANPALLEGRAALAWIHEGELKVVYRFETRGERIVGIELIGDRDRLRDADLVTFPRDDLSEG